MEALAVMRRLLRSIFGCWSRQLYVTFLHVASGEPRLHAKEREKTFHETKGIPELAAFQSSSSSPVTVL